MGINVLLKSISGNFQTIRASNRTPKRGLIVLNDGLNSENLCVIVFNPTQQSLRILNEFFDDCLAPGELNERWYATKRH